MVPREAMYTDQKGDEEKSLGGEKVGLNTWMLTVRNGMLGKFQRSLRHFNIDGQSK